VETKRVAPLRPSNWPDPQTLIQDAKQGKIDDRTTILAVDDLEDLAKLAEAGDEPASASQPTPNSLAPSGKLVHQSR
jgi:hypothetical protein